MPSCADSLSAYFLQRGKTRSWKLGLISRGDETNSHTQMFLKLPALQIASAGCISLLLSHPEQPSALRTMCSSQSSPQVENRQALSNFESIAEEADAVLLSRGNLGLDVPSEKVAIVQKAAITRCNILGKPVIITRVVDTMTSAPRCTR